MKLLRFLSLSAIFLSVFLFNTPTALADSPVYSNLSTTTSEQIASSFNYLVQSLGTGLSGTLTQIDLNTSNPTFGVYGSSPVVGLIECEGNTPINFLNNNPNCVNIYSAISGDSSQAFSSVQSFYPPAIILNPNKYYFISSSGNNIFNTLPKNYGSSEDLVSDGACYQYIFSLQIFVPCATVKDLYFSLHGITKSIISTSKIPVLIIPGVVGTEIFKESEKLWLDLQRNLFDIGDQFMDPLQFGHDLFPFDTSLTIGSVIKNPNNLFDYSEGLINELENQGFIQGTTTSSSLFLFPYDWRYSVISNIENLKQKIEDIRIQTGSNEVDVIAHSTGGLILKKYVMDNPSDNHVGKAIFVGVPNTGAPKAIKVLLQGDGFGIPWLADAEMKKIAENLPVVYDLSPSQKYFDVKGSYVKVVTTSLFSSTVKDLDFNQVRDFLIDDHDLNSQALSNSQNLHTISFDDFDLRTAGVDLYNIVGCRTGTIGKITEIRKNGILFDTVFHDISYVPGDGTVPLESSTNVPIESTNKYYSLETDHGKMMSADGIRQQIVNIISGSNLSVSDSKISQDIDKCKLNGKAISIFSPLDIDIEDQNGHHTRKEEGGIINEIPNADFEIIGEHKFVYLPTDEGQTYTISLKGTGNGVFTLIESDIVDNQILQTETYSEIPVTTDLKGRLDIINSKLLLDTNGDNNIDFELIGIPDGITIMPYVFSGFLQPINNAGPHSNQKLNIFKAGSTIPVKFQLKKQDGTITQARSTPIWTTPQQKGKTNLIADESASNTSVTSDEKYKWDPVDQQYIYNWKTKGLKSGYWYEISIKLDDGNTYSVTVGLK